MLALAYSDDTLDIYDGAVCYMFYRFFDQGVGMVWVRICLPKDFDTDQIFDLLKALKVGQQRSFDYWSANSRLYPSRVARYLQSLNSNLGYWRSIFLKRDLIPEYQVRCTLAPVIVRHEPILFGAVLFGNGISPDLVRVYSNWKLALLFVSQLRDILAAV
jgi:hypothetical protein